MCKRGRSWGRGITRPTPERSGGKGGDTPMIAKRSAKRGDGSGANMSARSASRFSPSTLRIRSEKTTPARALTWERPLVFHQMAETPKVARWSEAE